MQVCCSCCGRAHACIHAGMPSCCVGSGSEGAHCFVWLVTAAGIIGMCAVRVLRPTPFVGPAAGMLQHPQPPPLQGRSQWALPIRSGRSAWSSHFCGCNHSPCPPLPCWTAEGRGQLGCAVVAPSSPPATPVLHALILLLLLDVCRRPPQARAQACAHRCACTLTSAHPHM